MINFCRQCGRIWESDKREKQCNGPCLTPEELLIEQKRYKSKRPNFEKKYTRRNDGRFYEDGLPAGQSIAKNATKFNLKTGIYFLLDENKEFVYVGQSRNMHTRIEAHHREGKIDFTYVYCMNVERRNLNLYERKYITRLKPKYNVIHNCDVSRRKRS